MRKKTYHCVLVGFAIAAKHHHDSLKCIKRMRYHVIPQTIRNLGDGPKSSKMKDFENVPSELRHTKD